MTKEENPAKIIDLNPASEKFLQIQIDYIKEDVEELQEFKKMFAESNMTVAKTMERMAVVVEKLEEQNHKQDELIEKYTNSTEIKLEKVRSDVKEDIDSLKATHSSNTLWLRTMLEKTFTKGFKLVILVIVVLSGVKLLGADFIKLLSSF